MRRLQPCGVAHPQTCQRSSLESASAHSPPAEPGKTKVQFLSACKGSRLLRYSARQKQTARARGLAICMKAAGGAQAAPNYTPCTNNFPVTLAHQQIPLPDITGCCLPRLPVARAPPQLNTVCSTGSELSFYGTSSDTPFRSQHHTYEHRLQHSHQPTAPSHGVCTAKSSAQPAGSHILSTSLTHRNFIVVCAAWSLADICRLGA